ncbi:GNAT family N-acetyltransferase [Cellulomonas sp. APG4]|uniref:GNAT family N-acetyltransferase n=1 Tax=Cellulomonas sp. APG4 TaxID=1538656 RepID=UPI00137AA576|nr:GNAT family N-acetyltransferase [Cellulomonas sp. APG4]
MSAELELPQELPRAWREHPMLAGDRSRWSSLDAVGDDEGVLLTVQRAGRRTLLGLGDARRVDELLEELLARPFAPVGWMSLPRDTRVDERALSVLGLAPFSTWDWLVAHRAPDVDDPHGVDRLPRDAGPEVAECLVVANPGSSADPHDATPPGWWGARRDGRLVAVGGARLRGGLPGRHGRSWHVHGLGVRPELRGQGLGRAVAAAIARDAFTEGVDWVSLGVYADNHPARRLYTGLGFEVRAQFRSFGPAGAGRPPS